jgi:hypothetical protein
VLKSGPATHDAGASGQEAQCGDTPHDTSGTAAILRHVADVLGAIRPEHSRFSTDVMMISCRVNPASVILASSPAFGMQAMSAPALNVAVPAGDKAHALVHCAFADPHDGRGRDPALGFSFTRARQANGDQHCNSHRTPQSGGSVT